MCLTVRWWNRYASTRCYSGSFFYTRAGWHEYDCSGRDDMSLNHKHYFVSQLTDVTKQRPIFPGDEYVPTKPEREDRWTVVQNFALRPSEVYFLMKYFLLSFFLLLLTII